MFKSTLNLERAKKLYEVFSDGKALTRDEIVKMFLINITAVSPLILLTESRHNIMIINEKIKSNLIVYKEKSFKTPKNPKKQV